MNLNAFVLTPAVWICRVKALKKRKYKLLVAIFDVRDVNVPCCLRSVLNPSVPDIYTYFPIFSFQLLVQTLWPIPWYQSIKVRDSNPTKTENYRLDFTQKSCWVIILYWERNSLSNPASAHKEATALISKCLLDALSNSAQASVECVPGGLQ